MGKNNSELGRRRRATFCLLVSAVILYVLTGLIGTKLGATVKVGNLVFSRDSINGIVTGVYYMVCIFMVCVDYRQGIYPAMFCMGAMVLTLLMQIFKGQFGPLPGVVNCLISCVSIIIIYRFFKRNEVAATSDYLTGILNRRGFIYYIEKKILEKKKLSIIYIDIDSFRTINDNMGHEYGDVVLKTVAQRLKLYQRKGLKVARIGGAEFALAVCDHSNPVELAGMVIDSLGKPVEMEKDGAKVSYSLTMYAGISRYPEDSDSADVLVKYSDIAAYEARKSLKQHVVEFDHSMENEQFKLIEMQKTISEALENEYLYLVYQPQFTVQGKHLRGFETLLRYNKPGAPKIGPGEFIPIIEKTELVTTIDRYVLTRALREAKKFLLELGDELTISVNISSRNISNEGFADEIKNILMEESFPPACLELEITEYSLSQAMEIAIMNVKKLREMGVKIALDDFGTGYTSISQLVNLPVNLLKIDKSLIDHINETRENSELVQAVINMGHTMKCEVIAEGVEIQEQCDSLDEFKCDFIQGYIWGKPMEYSAATDLCKLEAVKLQMNKPEN